MILNISSETIGSRFVSVNGILLPGNDAIERIRGCCTPLWARNADANFPFSFKGSSWLCERKGIHFCVYTGHQMREVKNHRHPKEMFFLLREKGDVLIRGSFSGL